MKLPKKITPCPIVETILEIRFEASLPGDAVFGILYNQFKSRFDKLEKTPILSIPEQFRQTDPTFRFHPHYKLSADNFILQIGPDVFSISNTKEYVGWEKYRSLISDCLKDLFAANVVKKVSRIALRYINIFENANIFNNLTLDISLRGDSIKDNNINISSEFKSGDFVNLLKIVNNARATVGKETMNGSVVDIDTSYSKHVENNLDTIMPLIEQAHSIEKEFFFTLLNQDYIETLKPEFS
ncbi:MAG: TIGR04255 family protein [Desulfurivibrionaceae bacterium]|jgi:uncharacterized protein (TIGR04255 family)